MAVRFVGGAFVDARALATDIVEVAVVAATAAVIGVDFEVDALAVALGIAVMAFDIALPIVAYG